MSLSAANKEKIAANRRAIFELEGDVNHNKAKAYLTRSTVAENAALIAKNYNAAFLGNRQLANENTEALFRNRHALLQCLPTSNDVEVNFREAMVNKAKLDFLKHRSNLNAQVLSISQEMSALNHMAIEINRRVVEANEAIKEFNSDQIAQNTALIGAAHNPTPESNAALIAGNAASIEEIRKRVNSNNGTRDVLVASTETNRAAIIANSEQIGRRREAILKNHDAIAANRQRIAELVAARR